MSSSSQEDTGMRVSVVIPTFNSEERIGECLLSLGRQILQPHEIIVVDGGSTDSTASIVEKMNGVKLIVNEESHTPGSSRNRGAEAATGEVVFFCDSDCVADLRAVEYHVRAFEARNDISGVMGAIRNAVPGNPVSDFVQREIIVSQWLRSLNPDGSVKYLQTGTGNLSMYRYEFVKWKFREDQGFSEDTELSIRLGNKVKILFEPRAIVFHYHPTTVEDLFEQRKWYGERFCGITHNFKRDSFRPDSLFFSAYRYIDLPGELLDEAVSRDNRLLCEGCRIGKCRISQVRLPRHGSSDEYLCRVICLAFASGILKQRTGIDYSWK